MAAAAAGVGRRPRRREVGGALVVVRAAAARRAPGWSSIGREEGLGESERQGRKVARKLVVRAWIDVDVMWVRKVLVL